MDYKTYTPTDFLREFATEGKLTTMCANILESNGLTTMRDVCKCSRAELMSLNNFGDKCYDILIHAMHAAGLALEPDYSRGNIKKDDKMFDMAVTYLKSLGYRVILVNGDYIEA